MTEELAALIRRFFRYSFDCINYNYEYLTPEEKRICRPKEFAELVKWVKNENPEPTPQTPGFGPEERNV